MEENLRRMHEKKKKQIEHEYNQAQLFIHAVPDLLEAQSKRNVVKTNSRIIIDKDWLREFMQYSESEIADALGYGTPTAAHRAKMASIKERLANNAITREELVAELNNLRALPEGGHFEIIEPPIP